MLLGAVVDPVFSLWGLEFRLHPSPSFASLGPGSDHAPLSQCLVDYPSCPRRFCFWSHFRAFRDMPACLPALFPFFFARVPVDPPSPSTLLYFEANPPQQREQPRIYSASSL